MGRYVVVMSLIFLFVMSLRKISENTGFCWSVFFRQMSESYVLFLYGKIWVIEIPYSCTFYVICFFYRSVALVVPCFPVYNLKFSGIEQISSITNLTNSLLLSLYRMARALNILNIFNNCSIISGAHLDVTGCCCRIL